MEPFARKNKVSKRVFSRLFEASGTGPELVTCYQEMQYCAVGSLQKGRPVTCRVKEKCEALAA